MTDRDLRRLRNWLDRDHEGGLNAKSVTELRGMLRRLVDVQERMAEQTARAHKRAAVLKRKLKEYEQSGVREYMKLIGDIQQRERARACAIHLAHNGGEGEHTRKLILSDEWWAAMPEIPDAAVDTAAERLERDAVFFENFVTLFSRDNPDGRRNDDIKVFQAEADACRAAANRLRNGHH